MQASSALWVAGANDRAVTATSQSLQWPEVTARGNGTQTLSVGHEHLNRRSNHSVKHCYSMKSTIKTNVIKSNKFDELNI